MRHYSFFVLTLVMLMTISNNAFAKKAGSRSFNVEHSSNASATSTHEDMQIPLSQSAKNDEHAKKIPVPKSEELPHIHHFHKERVKKSKKHHKKYWAVSQLILILCHIAILVMAYMHATPH